MTDLIDDAANRTANDTTSMEETMGMIDRAEEPVNTNKRETLTTDITKLKNDIRIAEDSVQKMKDENSYTPISPELANEHKRGIVFLKKELDKKNSEFKELDT